MDMEEKTLHEVSFREFLDNVDQFAAKQRASVQTVEYTQVLECACEAPSFKDYVQKLRDERIDVTQFNEFIDLKRSIQAIPYLNEAENAEVEKWVRLFEEECGGDINNLDEGWLGKLVGGAAGFVIGPSIGRIIANALGVDRGVLYDMFTSRVVSAALGVAIAKGLGGEYKK